MHNHEENISSTACPTCTCEHAQNLHKDHGKGSCGYEDRSTTIYTYCDCQSYTPFNSKDMKPNGIEKLSEYPLYPEYVAKLNEVIDHINSLQEKPAPEKEKERIGKEFWEWFYQETPYEEIEAAIERITGVKDTWRLCNQDSRPCHTQEEKEEDCSCPPRQHIHL